MRMREDTWRRVAVRRNRSQATGHIHADATGTAMGNREDHTFFVASVLAAPMVETNRMGYFMGCLGEVSSVGPPRRNLTRFRTDVSKAGRPVCVDLKHALIRRKEAQPNGWNSGCRAKAWFKSRLIINAVKKVFL